MSKNKYITISEKILNSSSIKLSDILVSHSSKEQKVTADMKWSSTTWKGKDVSDKIPVRIVEPKNAEKVKDGKVILFFHGGPGITADDYEKSPFKKFFTSLVKKGFSVVAPEIRGSQEYATMQLDDVKRLYREDVKDVVDFTKEYFTLKVAPEQYYIVMDLIGVEMP
jgi:dipeptidyl aminopeptidase/acylaminoacyl peptidase